MKRNIILLILFTVLISTVSTKADELNAEQLFDACRGADSGQWKRFVARHRAYLIRASQESLVVRVSDNDVQYALPHLFDSPYYKSLPRIVLSPDATPRQCAGNWLIFRPNAGNQHNSDLLPNVFLRIIPDSINPEAVYYLPILHFTYIPSSHPESDKLSSVNKDELPDLRNITVFGGDPHLSGTQTVQNQFVYLKHNDKKMICNNYLYDGGIISAVARMKFDMSGRNGSASIYDFFNQNRDSGIPLMRIDFKDGKIETLYVYGENPPWASIENRDETHWPARYPDEMQLLTRIRDIIYPDDSEKIYTTVFSEFSSLTGRFNIPKNITMLRNGSPVITMQRELNSIINPCFNTLPIRTFSISTNYGSAQITIENQSTGITPNSPSKINFVRSMNVPTGIVSDRGSVDISWNIEEELIEPFLSILEYEQLKTRSDFGYIHNININTISNINEIIQQAKRGDIIEISAGEYHLSKTVHFYGRRDLTLRGKGPVRLILDDRSSQVIYVGYSENISIENISATHRLVPEKICSGAVITIWSSSRVNVIDCELDGCGVFGLHAVNSENLIVQDCYIHHNTQAAFNIQNCTLTSISDCRIENNPLLFLTHGNTPPEGVHIEGCTIDNK